MNKTKFALATALLCFPCSNANSQTVDMSFELSRGQASSDPIVFPNDNIEIMVTPELEIESGQFTATFESDVDGVVVDGAKSVHDFVASGSLNLVFASQIEVFGNPIPASATLSGPLLVTQITESTGTLSDQSDFAESQPGTYDVSFGPFECTDSAFGLFCVVIENGLQLDLPDEPLQAEGVSLPFLGGVYTQLNVVGESTVGTQLDLALPVGEGFGFNLALEWRENSRTLNAPEPVGSWGAWWIAIFFLRRKRRLARLEFSRF